MDRDEAYKILMENEEIGVFEAKEIALEFGCDFDRKTINRNTLKVPVETLIRSILVKCNFYKDERR